MSAMQSEVRRVVVGLGVTGLSCARHFKKMQLPFVLADTRIDPPGWDALADQFDDVEVYIGSDSHKAIESANEIYLSPGIALDSPAIKEAKQRSVPIYSDIDLFAQAALAPVIAITGSNAKSTVTSLVGDMAVACGLDTGVGGNLGVAALDLLDESRDCYVLELSSFQLERLSFLKPKVAALLNVSSDHMDRHGTMQAYHLIKQRVFCGAETLVFNRDDSLTTPLQVGQSALISFGRSEPDQGQFGLISIEGQRFIAQGSEPLMPVSELKLIGTHNYLNVLAAFAIGFCSGFDVRTMCEVARQFRGLKHRCEFIQVHNDIRYFNDSKATNVGASVAAIESIAAEFEGELVVIAGGQTKNAEFSDFAAAVVAAQAKLVLIGEGAAIIAAAMPEETTIRYANSMNEAVKVASQLLNSNGTVLLSPACASFDMFDGFEQRGDAFVSAVSNRLSHSESIL